MPAGTVPQTRPRLIPRRARSHEPLDLLARVLERVSPPAAALDRHGLLERHGDAAGVRASRWRSVSATSDTTSNRLFVAALGLPALYLLGCGAMLFAGEHEAGTYEFQRSLPTPAWPVFAAKVAFALLSESPCSSRCGCWPCWLNRGELAASERRAWRRRRVDGAIALFAAQNVRLGGALLASLAAGAGRGRAWRDGRFRRRADRESGAYRPFSITPAGVNVLASGHRPLVGLPLSPISRRSVARCHRRGCGPVRCPPRYPLVLPAEGACHWLRPCFRWASVARAPRIPRILPRSPGHCAHRPCGGSSGCNCRQSLRAIACLGRTLVPAAVVVSSWSLRRGRLLYRHPVDRKYPATRSSGR